MQSSAGGGMMATHSKSLRGHQIAALDIVTIIIGAFAIEIEVRRPVDAAEARLFAGVGAQHHDDVALRDFAAGLAVATVEAPIDTTKAYAHALARHYPGNH